MLKKKKGQAITEFVVMLAMMLGVAIILTLFIRVFSRYGWRILSLIGMDYP